MIERHSIGGVVYVPLTTATVEHDVWLMGKLRRAGVDEVEYRPGDTPEAWAQRLTFEMAARGEMLSILAALLLPEAVGADNWTPAVAAETEKHFASLTDADDKEAVFGLLLTSLLGFFESGLCSIVNLRTFSLQGTQPVAP